MKIVATLVFIFASSFAAGACEKIGHRLDKKDDEDSKETLLGGCSYFSPIFRVGYSNEYESYVGFGGILPFNQTSDWEGGYKDEGIAFVLTKYETGNIYDIGYTNRTGWAIFSTGWDVGLSYGIKGKEEMRGLYIGGTFMGSILLRYLESDMDSQLSIDIGIKY